MVDWPRYFSMLKAATVPMPLQVHAEYEELGSAASGRKQLDLPQAKVVAQLRKDIEAVRKYRNDAGLG